MMIKTIKAKNSKTHTTLEQFSDKVGKVAKYYKYSKDLGEL